MRQRLREEHPDIQAMKARIAAQKALERQEEEQELEKSREAKGPTKPTSPRRVQQTPEQRQKLVALQAQMTALQKEIETRQADVARVTRDIQSVEARLAVLPVREQEMAALTRDYETSKANYKSLLDKSFAADMATEMEKRQQSERFTILDRAHVPEKPAKPYQKLMMSAGGCVFSLVLGLLLALGLEFRKGCLLGEWELPREVTVLGTVPYIEMAALDRGAGNWKVWAAASSLLLGAAAAAGLYWMR